MWSQVQHSFGSFFGFTEFSTKKWTEKAQKKINQMEFGINLKPLILRAVQKKDHYEFLEDAEEMLLVIRELQKEDELLESFHVEDGEQEVNEVDPLEVEMVEDVKFTRNPTYQDEDAKTRPVPVKDKRLVKPQFDAKAGSSDVCIKNRVKNDSKIDAGPQTAAIISDMMHTIGNEDKTGISTKENSSETPQIIIVDGSQRKKSLEKPIIKIHDVKDLASRVPEPQTKIPPEDIDKLTGTGDTVTSKLAIPNETPVHGVDQMVYQVIGVQGIEGLVPINANNIEESVETDESRSINGSSSNKTATGIPGPDELVKGAEALEQYRLFKETEDFLEEEEKTKEEARRDRYEWKLNAVDELIGFTTNYCSNTRSVNEAKWRELKKNILSKGREKLRKCPQVRRSMPEHPPVFTYSLCLVQILVFSILSIHGGFAPIGLEPELKIEEDVPTFLGVEEVHMWVPTNVWLGPSQTKMIEMGALFAACVRYDLEASAMYIRQGYSVHLQLGCCEVKSRFVSGTTTKKECKEFSVGVGKWSADVPCVDEDAWGISQPKVLRPCCVGLKGECRLLSYKHCLFYKGIFHHDGPSHCSQVNCLGEVCSIGKDELKGSPNEPWIPAYPFQWWRVFVSFLYHHGIIHLVLVTSAQCILFTQVERTAGSLRTFCIYFLSCKASLLASVGFQPYEVHVGGIGSICGMLAVVMLEVIQFWNIIPCPRTEMAKLVVTAVVFLFCGTLPYVSMVGLLVGFVIGGLTGMTFLPYITLGIKTNKAKVRKMLSTGCYLVLNIIFIVLIAFIFYVDVSHCGIFKAINCVPYTKNMCNESLWQEWYDYIY